MAGATVALSIGGQTRTATASLSGGGTATATRSINVDTVPPTLAITSGVAAVKIGETATVTFTFSEAPVGFAAGDIATSGGTLSGLAVTTDPKVYTALFTPTAGFTGAAGNNGGAGTTPTIAIVFNYTILAGQTDANGISIAANSLNLNGGTIREPPATMPRSPMCWLPTTAAIGWIPPRPPTSAPPSLKRPIPLKALFFRRTPLPRPAWR
ncbi:MAG: Ig-like domain-containing protein [Gallionellaceae bacterium]|nr:Ig-like domain-containing protein [Gallionellaceae bacterium]